MYTYSVILFNKHLESSQIISVDNQLNGFRMIFFITGMNFWQDLHILNALRVNADKGKFVGPIFSYLHLSVQGVKLTLWLVVLMICAC